MRAFLLRVAGLRRPVFYTEDVETARFAAKAPSARTARGRLERWARSLKAMLLRVGRSGGSWTRTLVGWLLPKAAPDEPLLAALRSTESLEIVYPKLMSEARARRAWLSYLSGRRGGHGVRALVDVILAALTLPLMLLPGPNVIGFWFLWRAATHGLAILGINRARGGKVPTTWRPDDLLSAALSREGPAQVAAVSSEYGLKDLAGFLRRVARPSNHE